MGIIFTARKSWKVKVSLTFVCLCFCKIYGSGWHPPWMEGELVQYEIDKESLNAYELNLTDHKHKRLNYS